ncbi:hypothetical protein EHO60_12595 [Leptospira fletcheri]|uniref:Uncharacterized protein n=1 Tax=Leptospira fletcheri TaxID=2484981 RepID=A0A4V6QKP5_9LEPT|nr:hypothetical protein [Leptospira fletcheri]TGK08869.1 hypothetical protein EHO60_12595 [Leptospira fletcheri]
MGSKIRKKKSAPSVLRPASVFLLSFCFGLSFLYAENNSNFLWDSFGIFPSGQEPTEKAKLGTTAEEPKEKPTVFFSSLTLKSPFEVKLLHDLVPSENESWKSIPGMDTVLPRPLRMVRGRREFFSLYPSLGKEEVFVMALSSSTPKAGNGEAYVGTSTERRTFDSLTDIRSQSTPIPGGNQNISRGLDNQAGNVSVGYAAGNAGIQFGLGMRMAGNSAGLAVPESAKSSIGISYSLLSGSTSQNHMDFFLQFSGIKRFNDRTLLSVETPMPFKGWHQGYEYYVNPGFSVATRNLRFEGLVRVPLHQPFPTTDGVLTPEIQGQLGVKYSFSESSPNLPK